MALPDEVVRLLTPQMELRADELRALEQNAVRLEQQADEARQAADAARAELRQALAFLAPERPQIVEKLRERAGMK